MRFPKPTAAARRGRNLQVSLTAAGAALLLCLGPLAGAARAQDSSEPSWIPSFDVSFDTYSYSADVDIINKVNPPNWETSGNADAVELRVHLGGELAGPRLDWLPGKPRIFTRGGIGLPTFASDQLISTGVLQGDPEMDINLFVNTARNRDVSVSGISDRFSGQPPVHAPPNPNGIPDCFEQGFTPASWTCATRDPSSFPGQGGRVDVKIGDVSWYAGIGLDFEFALGESVALHVKPSLAYQGEPVDLSGVLVTVSDAPVPIVYTCLPGKQCLTGIMDPQNPSTREFAVQEFTVWRASGGASTVDHSLGPGIELALDLFRRVRPVRTTLYADARFLWVIGSTDTSFSDEYAAWNVDRDRFGVRGGAGIRFSWMGFGAER